MPSTARRPSIRRCGRRERFYFTLCFPSFHIPPLPLPSLIPQPFRKPLSPSLHSKKAADRASDITAAFRSFIIAVIKPYNQQHSRATERRKKEGQPAPPTQQQESSPLLRVQASCLPTRHTSPKVVRHILSAANSTAAPDIPHTKTGHFSPIPDKCPEADCCRVRVVRAFARPTNNVSNQAGFPSRPRRLSHRTAFSPR